MDDLTYALCFLTGLILLSIGVSNIWGLDTGLCVAGGGILFVTLASSILKYLEPPK